MNAVVYYRSFFSLFFLHTTASQIQFVRMISISALKQKTKPHSVVILSAMGNSVSYTRGQFYVEFYFFLEQINCTGFLWVCILLWRWWWWWCYMCDSFFVLNARFALFSFFLYVVNHRHGAMIVFVVVVVAHLHCGCAAHHRLSFASSAALFSVHFTINMYHFYGKLCWNELQPHFDKW